MTYVNLLAKVLNGLTGTDPSGDSLCSKQTLADDLTLLTQCLFCLLTVGYIIYVWADNKESALLYTKNVHLSSHKLGRIMASSLDLISLFVKHDLINSNIVFLV